MKIIIDGDACPNVNEIYELSNKYNIKLILAIDNSHFIKNNNINTIIVDTKSQNVDVKISNIVDKNDIVITNDYGLSAIIIGKGSNVINHNGMIIDKNNIDSLLELRHIKYKLRKRKVHLKGSKKRNFEDEKKFLDTLEKLILLNLNF